MGRITSFARRAAFGLVLAALVSSCTSLYRNHGYVPNDDDLAAVKVGKSTQDDVAAAIGRPSSSGILSGSGWYYVGSKFLHYGGRAPKEVEREVVAVSFDEKGVVENIERFGLENGKAVVISRRVTDSNIKGIGFLRQLLGNLGNLNAGQILGNN
jgi:outer membrane protein assembly factor BamE (lipoprotein component of BamABCDE complex)